MEFENTTELAPLPPLLFITRFSFFGKSGWKSNTSEDKELLFKEDRLEQRMYLFENVTLPSLIAQTDSEFHHLVLSSSELPDLAKIKLRKYVSTHLEINVALYSNHMAAPESTSDTS